jgi:hypothetical protein
VLRLLRDNWLWIVGPIVVVALILIALILLGGGDNAAGFEYKIF